MHPSGPAIQPLSTTIPFSVSTFNTLTFWVVTCCPPIFPGIFLPGKTLEPLPWDAPDEPIVLWFLELPWDAGWPLKFHRFIPPANPFPKQFALASTNWPSMNHSGPIDCPTSSNPSAFLTLNSDTNLFGATPEWENCPNSGLVRTLGCFQPAPICTAKYPWFFLVLFANTWTRSSCNTVHGVRFPVSGSYKAVIPFLTARAPVLSGSVKSFRLSAAAGDMERVGRPAVCWLKRLGFPRAGAVVQPYLTPRFAVNGRNASGRRKLEGNCALQLVGSFGAIVVGDWCVAPMVKPWSKTCGWLILYGWP